MNCQKVKAHWTFKTYNPFLYAIESISKDIVKDFFTSEASDK